MSGRRTEGGAEIQAAQAIAALVTEIQPGQLLRHAVVVVQTEDDDGVARTDTHYPLGEPDLATERAMLEGALSQLRHGQ